ncbi:alkaline phosphatase family protein [Aliiroseovarius sp. YM-037]|uniref:alkaline phosphatase family protein n=1 Tax=Aliiroseovarius sp. YM-037 TaxID=3341728 RepID=UPI003A80C6B3
MPQPNNVLFIIIDQLRADCLFGRLADHVDTPNLDALMQDAVTFRRHYSVTNPCGPSRASILTGQYAMNHRSVRNGTPLRHTIPTLPAELRKAGHLPLLYGYTDTSQDPAAYPPGDPALQSYEQPMVGFEEIVEMRMETSYPWRADLLAKGYRFDNYFEVFCHQAADGQKPQLNDPAFYRAEDSDTAFLTNACLNDLRGRVGESWFAHLTYLRPHPPLVAPAPYNTMYDPGTLPLPERQKTPEDEAALHPFFDPAVKTQTAGTMALGFSSMEATDDAVQQLRATYMGLATEVDHHVGRVIAFLKDTGQYDNTLIVVTSDHGEMLGDHHSWGKMNLHDAAYHTPLIIRAPGYETARGAVVDAPTESVDVAPTILHVLGLDVPPSMDGYSLLPLLNGETPDDWRTYSYSELDFADAVNPTPWQDMLGTTLTDSALAILREDRFTLIQFSAESLPPILFDHAADRAMKNVANDPAHQGDLLRLTQKLLRHRMKHADQTLATTQITDKGPIKAPRHS